MKISKGKQSSKTFNDGDFDDGGKMQTYCSAELSFLIENQ